MNILLLKARACTDLGFSPPLGLLYILGFCRTRMPQHQFHFRDFHVERTSDAGQLAYIEQINPHIIGIPAVTDELDDVLTLAAKIRGRLPNCRIVLGGHHPTARPNNHYPNIDTVVVGEGEQAFHELVMMAERGEAWPTSYASPTHLDDIDIPAAWDMLSDPRGYHMNGSPFAYPGPVASITASRGCPYRCTFCSSLVWRRVKPFFRFRSAGSVADEIETIRDRYGLQNFYFTDDAINANLKQLEQMLDEFIRRDLRIRWAASFLGNLRQSPEWLFPKLKAAGCKGFSFGIESGSQRVLSRIGKGLQLDDVKEVLRRTKAAGLFNNTFFILGNAWYGTDGLPDGETAEDLHATEIYVRSLVDSGLLDYTSISIARPYPGSELGDMVEKLGLSLENDRFDTDLVNRRVLSFRHPHLTADEVQATYQRLWEMVSFHPQILLNQVKMMRNLDEARRVAAIAWFQAKKLFQGRLLLGGATAGQGTADCRPE